ncbi:MAG: O-antigen ligase family protein [Bryobacteraceae bacterium]
MNPATPLFWQAIDTTAPSERSLRRRPEFRLLLVVCWVLSITCLSMPGRGGPLELSSVDWIALIKIMARGGSLLCLGMILLRMHDNRRTGHVLARLIPLALFALWCMTSTLWSAMKAVSFGHAVEVFTLVLLSIVTAILCSSEEYLEAILFQLFLTALILSAGILLLDMKAVLAGERPAGYVHPNTLGAISSIGLILLLGSRLLWRWKWTQRFLVAGLPICFAALYISRSRSSLLATFIVLTILFLVKRQMGFLTVTLSIAGILIGLFPYLDAIKHVPDSIGGYILRGQTQAEVMGGSGRDELWAIALASFRDAPWFGHGYFTITNSGSLFVWHKQQFQTAHNLALHLLTGAGLFGAALFIWGIGAALKPCFANWRGFAHERRIEFLVSLVFVWYLILGCFEISMLGPLNEAVLAFFVATGTLVGSTIPRTAAR